MELTLFLDHQCNLRCSYCYNGEKFTRRMTRPVIERAIDLGFERDRQLDVSFFGGEPLLRLDLMRAAIEYAEQQAGPDRPPPRFIVNTNATLISDEALELMAAPRQVSVFLSVDGPRELHDQHRVNAAGRGSYDDVMAGIARLREAGIRFQIVCVVNPQTADRLGDTLEALLPLGAAKVNFSPNFRADWTEAGVSALRAGLAAAGDLWMDAFRAGRSVPVDPLHTKILGHLRQGVPCPIRCQLAGRELAVSPAGRLYPCAQMIGEDIADELVIGDVELGVNDGAVARLQREKEQVEQTCQGCDLRGRCQSQCGCRHVALTGRLGEITEALCELEAAFIDEADRVAETLFAEQCPAFLSFYYQQPWQAAEGAQITRLRRSRGD